MNNWVYAQYSEIHNIGLFTFDYLIKGEELPFPEVPEISFETYIALKQSLGEKEKALFLTTDDKVYDIRNSLLRYMNHSKEPNIDWKNGLTLIPLRDIVNNEELTIDYGWDKYDWEE